MTPPLARLEQAIVAGAQYALRVAMSVDVAGTKPPAVLAVTYLDAQGCVLEGPAEGFLPSPQFGLYRYLGRADQTGDVTERVTLVPPAGAAHARLTVHVWQTAQVRMRAEPRIALVPLGGQSPAQAGSISIRLLACADTDVAPGDGILVRVRFAPGTVLEPRAALATVQAFDADGAALPLGDQVPVSDAVGPFRYLKPLDTASSGGGSGAADQVWAGFGMTLPKGTHRLAVQVLRWITEHPLHVQEIVFAPPAGPILAQGSTDVTDRTEVRFCATLRPHRINSGAPMAMLEAQVLDAYGQELDAPIAGLVRQEALWPNIRWRQPGPGHKQRGHNAPPPAPVGEVLLLPEGAARLHWRLRAASDAPDLAVDLVGAPMVQDTTTDPMDQLAAIPWATDRPTGRLDLPNTLFDAAAAGRVSLLGGAHRVTGPGWLRVTAHITQEGASKDAPPKTGLPPGTVQIWPWVRHAHTGWGTPPPSGLITGLDGILVADVQPVDTTGKVEATLLLPPETTEVLILAFSHMDLAATGWSCGALALHPARPDAVTLIHGPTQSLGDEHTADLSDPALSAVADLAHRLGDLPAEAQARRALASRETSPRGHRAAARRLRSQLALIDGAWAPDPAPFTPMAPPNADTVLCLAPLAPGEQARRLDHLMTHRGGACHWVDRLPKAPSTATTPALPDGDIQDTTGPITRHALRFAAMDPDQMLATDRLNFETRLWQRSLVQSDAGLVQASDGVDGTDRALAGLALARAHDLPFVYDRTGFTAHLWRADSADAAALQSSRLTRLRLAQETRLLAAADMILVPSDVFHDRLRQRGIPAGRIAVVPQGVHDIAQSDDPLPPPPQVATLRPGVNLVGVICDPQRPGAAALALAALAQHPDRASLHLVLLDATHSPDPLNATATGVLSGPGSDALRCAWMDVCDIILAPARPDLRADWTPPLTALEVMARGRPLILADRPYARDLAGPDLDRAWICPAGDAAALTRIWVEAEADMQGTLSRQTRASTWARTQSWSAAAKALAQAHHDARILYRERLQ